MGTCVQSHALLSALALRIEREGFDPPESDLAALLALGIPEADIAAALERAGEAGRRALATLRRAANRRSGPG